MTNEIAMDWLLPQVEKPARYIGGEWNAVTKEASGVKLRLCLAFPDLYELGLGNLGLQILYSILNDQPEVWAERAYLPGPDMEALMKHHGVPLRMLESQESIRRVDGIGFTLQSELTFVNVLKMLRMAEVPLFSQDRDDAMPLVFAGGPGAYNPEPMAPFMDFFVIGDGEEVILEIVECLLRTAGRSRMARLEALSAVEGIYVPALFPVETLADGRIVPESSHNRVRARFVKDLDPSPFPDKLITPYVQLVHDGVGIEVLRGCTHGCRFCQAGMLTRPVRERSISRIDTLLEQGLGNSGMEEATLVSLSTCDYSRARELLQRAAGTVGNRRAALSLPSLRLDRFSVELADYVASMRRSGLTFAPEAGTSRLRSVINKDVSDEQLLSLAEEAFRRGWTHIKLYFMIGLPTETDADVEAIADLSIRTLNAGRRINSRAQLRLGVSTFVPKPFTPFQWAAQIGIEETRSRQHRLADLLRAHRRINFGRHAPESSFMEGLLSRADRRAAPLLVSVLDHGGGYETWDERRNFNAWRVAIEETNYPVDQMFAARGEDERFPWDHVDAQVTREALLAEWKRAGEARYTTDCRAGACSRCGARRYAQECCDMMQERSRSVGEMDTAPQAGTKEDRTNTLTEAPNASRPGVQRLRFRVGRGGRLRFLSHLEMVQAWIRALRRAGAPLAYSQGFHAHPKVTFSTALPVGEASEAEFMDVVLVENRTPSEMLEALKQTLPEDLYAYEVMEVEMSTPSLMALLTGHTYRLFAACPEPVLQERLSTLSSSAEWIVERLVKNRAGSGGGSRRPIEINIRPLVTSLERVHELEPDAHTVCVEFSTHLVDGKLAKAKEVALLLGFDLLQTHIVKIKSFLAE